MNSTLQRLGRILAASIGLLVILTCIQIASAQETRGTIRGTVTDPNGQAVANAKQFHREQYVAETLQRSFLPSVFPSRAGLELSAHYRPGSTEADVGGDWYDAFENESGDVVLTIGDVTGKGVEAARLMVLMRQAIRVAALSTSEPKAIADTCNRLLLVEGAERLASAFIGVLEPHTRRLKSLQSPGCEVLIASESRHLYPQASE